MQEALQRAQQVSAVELARRLMRHAGVMASSQQREAASTLNSDGMDAPGLRALLLSGEAAMEKIGS